MIDGNQLREEFGRYLAEHKATRWGMDAALMHVCKIAYDAGKADGPGAVLHSRAILKECMRLLAAAPAPDQFRDAAKMMAEPADPDPLHLSRILHELAGAASLCWEPRPTGVFDSQLAIQFVEQALAEIRSRMTSAPAEAPKPVAYGFGNTAITGHTNRLMMVRIDIPGGDQYAGAFWLPLVLADEAHTYGVACRAAGEAAGYARGLADAGRDAERRGKFLVECNDVALRIDPFGYGIYDAIDGDGQPYQSQALADEIAAMRGEVKP